MQQIASDLRASIASISSAKLQEPLDEKGYLTKIEGYAAALFAEKYLDKALCILRTLDYFLDPKQLSFAHHVIDRAIVALNGQYYPNTVDFAGAKTACDLSNWNEIRHELANSHNPFVSFYENCIPEIISVHSPNIVAISVTEETQLMPAIALSQAIKRYRPETHIAWGGEEAAKLQTKIISEPQFFEFVDSVLFKDAEYSIIDLVRSIEGGGAIEDVPNVGCVGGVGTVTHKRRRTPKLDLNLDPDFSDFALGTYLSPVPVLPIRISRGCYWNNCAFCTLNDSYSRYDQQPFSEVVSLIRRLSSHYGTNCFRIADKAVSPGAMRRFCSALLEVDDRYSWYAFTRGEREFDRSMTDLMAKAGCCKVFIGVESASDRTLMQMKKGVSVSELQSYIANCHESGVAVHLSFICGFPGETEEEVLQIPEVYLTNSAQVTSPGFSVYVFPFMLERNNHVWLSPEQYGVEVLGTDSAIGVIQNYAVKTGLNHDDVEKVRQELNSMIARKCDGRSMMFDFFADYRFSDYVVYHRALGRKLYEGQFDGNR
jgi:anaerobic magnesium-protoporphyrin IX monomethyl ester cyclase